MKPAEGSTVIGKSVTIRGELSANEDLYIDGDMEGTITLPDYALTIGPNARVLSNIRAKDVIVFGDVKGDLHATGKVEIRGSAVVKGDIFSKRLSIEENATLRGKVDLGRSAESGSDVPSVSGKPQQENLLLEHKA
jgi:cytoskeletal protein CcmA (bactofilin family)